MQKDEYGKTALIYASQEGQYSTVQLLLKKGANAEAAADEYLKIGWTALMYALDNNHSKVVELLSKKSKFNIGREKLHNLEGVDDFYVVLPKSKSKAANFSFDFNANIVKKFVAGEMKDISFFKGRIEYFAYS